MRARQRWCIRTDRGDDMRARFVIMSNGPLNRPKLPGIPGIRDYRGHTFHTSRWDYDYTGGSPDGGLHKLADKRVGIIGTGATAVQCVPHLGASAKALYVFQRTPSSVDVRDNRRTDPAWAASLQSGWQRERMENFNTLTSGGVVEKDLIQDGWTETIRNLISMAKFRGTGVDWNDVPKLMEIADFQKMNQIRARVDSIVKDKATAEALKPWYRQFCKRPCFHDDYLPTFNRDNVHLIDTDGHGVERITETGVVANGVEYEVDCIVFATGFEVGTEYTRRSGYDVVGRDGLTLSAKWADGFRSLHGYTTHGFPNLFIVGQLAVRRDDELPARDGRIRAALPLRDQEMHATRASPASSRASRRKMRGWSTSSASRASTRIFSPRVHRATTTTRGCRAGGAFRTARMGRGRIRSSGSRRRGARRGRWRGW